MVYFYPSATGGRNFSLVPFFNFLGGSFDGDTANFGQVGVGLTWH